MTNAAALNNQPPPQAEYATYTQSVRIVIMIAVMMGTVMQMVDTSIVNVAIPTIMGNLGATLDQITWVSTGYILANVIVLPMTGWLSAVFGRRKYLAGSIALFTFASVCCGLSRSLGMLVAFRVLQGIGGAALISTAQATMMEIFPPRQLGMVQAIYGMGVIIGPTIGPTLGGWITDNLSWPWIFYVNLPIGIVAAIFCLSFMHDSRYARKIEGGIDFVGIALLALGLGSLQMVLDKGTHEGWFESGLIVWLTVCAVLGLLTFVIWELSIKHPVVNLRVLRHRSFAAGTAFGMALGFGLFGGIFILPIFLQNVRHYTALQTGLLMMPAAIASAFVMPITGRLVNRFSPRNLTAIGVVGVTISMFMLCRMTQDTGPAQLYPALILRGLAMGLLWAPLTLATLVGLQGHEMAEGVAFFNLSRQLGGSAGIAFLSTLLEARITYHYDRLAEHVSLYSQPTVNHFLQLLQFFMSKGSPQQVAEYQAIGVLSKIVHGQATILAYDDIFLIMGILFACTIVLLFFLDKRRPEARAAAALKGE